MKRAKKAQRTRGKDRQPRQMQPTSLSNLLPIPALHDGLECVPARVRADAHTVKQWLRLSPAERGEVVRLGLMAREMEA